MKNMMLSNRSAMLLSLPGVALLGMAVWAMGYGSARAHLQTAQRVVERVDLKEMDRLRKQVQVLKGLVERYQEELAYVDEQLAKGGGK